MIQYFARVQVVERVNTSCISNFGIETARYDTNIYIYIRIPSEENIYRRYDQVAIDIVYANTWQKWCNNVTNCSIIRRSKTLAYVECFSSTSQTYHTMEHAIAPIVPDSDSERFLFVAGVHILFLPHGHMQLFLFLLFVVVPKSGKPALLTFHTRR